MEKYTSEIIEARRQLMIANLKNLDIVKKQEEYELSSGNKSKIYIDMKYALAFSDHINEIGAQIHNMYTINPHTFDNIASSGVGGIPLGTIVSYFQKVPHIPIRMEKKEYGTKKTN